MFTVFIFVLGMCLGFAALLGVGDRLYYLFNLLFLPVIWVAMREGYAGVALALVTIQLTLAAITAFIGYDTTDFAILQLLMLVLSITGLLLGAVTTERKDAALRLREQQRELTRMASDARAGALGMALAHEVSQPLSTVAAYVHAARRLLQSSVASEPVMDALIKAEAEAQRAREVLERVRDFLSSGNLNLNALDVSGLAENQRHLPGGSRLPRGRSGGRKRGPGPGCQTRTGSRSNRFSSTWSPMRSTPLPSGRTGAGV